MVQQEATDTISMSQGGGLYIMASEYNPVLFPLLFSFLFFSLLSLSVSVLLRLADAVTPRPPDIWPRSQGESLLSFLGFLVRIILLSLHTIRHNTRKPNRKEEKRYRAKRGEEEKERWVSTNRRWTSISKMDISYAPTAAGRLARQSTPSWS